MAAKIFEELRERGLEAEPVGIDMSDMVTLHALQRAGSTPPTRSASC